MTLPLYLIDGHLIQRDVGRYSDYRRLSDVVRDTATRVPLDLGWLPPGVRSYRQFGDSAIVCVECPPAIHLTIWTDVERSAVRPEFLLAMPYRVIIGLFQNNALHGARMFYSPEPINTPGQQLYHCNLPNINCLGYGGNGVGWVCLYQTDQINGSIGDRVRTLIERCTYESYNDANMRNIDGPGIYRLLQRPEFTYKPQLWEQRTENEGVGWTLDPDLWIPVTVRGRDNQSAHYEGGVPLTVEMAMYGAVAYYYHEMTQHELYRFEQDMLGDDDIISAVFNAAYNIAPPVNDDDKPRYSIDIDEPHLEIIDCNSCGGSDREDKGYVVNGDFMCGDCMHEFTYCVKCERFSTNMTSVIGVGSVCGYCQDQYSACDRCGQLCGVDLATHSLYGDDAVCPRCLSFVITCPGCDIEVLRNDHHCPNLNCHICGVNNWVDQFQKVDTSEGTFWLCRNCKRTYTACEECARLSLRKKMFNKRDESLPLLQFKLVCPDCYHNGEKAEPTKTLQPAVSKED